MAGRTRLIRWTGHPAPFEAPDIRKKLALGVLPMAFVDAMTWFDSDYRLSAPYGISEFSVGPQHGFSRTYQWGRYIYEQEMDEADWQLLIKHPLDRVMFLDLTDNPQAWPRQLNGPQWEELIAIAQKEKRPQVFLGL